MSRTATPNSAHRPEFPMKSRRVTLRLKSTLLAAAAAMAFILPSPVAIAPAGAQSADSVVKLARTGGAQRLKLGLNKSIVIDLPEDAYDILVANPAVADAVTRTSRRIYLFGKQVGETNIFVFSEDGRQIVSLDLAIERDVVGLEGYLEKYIKGSSIKVELINDNVVLTGTVQTPLDSSRAAQLAEIFVTGGEATTGNFSSTAGGGAQGGDVAIDNPDNERRTSKIVNLLSIVGEDQVTLKVTVAEVQRSVIKQLGVDMLTCDAGAAGGACSGTGFGNEPFAGLDKFLNRSSIIRGSIGSTSIASYIRAMESAGVLRTLAEPNLTAISGEQATFRAGGEFPMIVGCEIDPDNGQITYESERMDYGVGLEFMPVVLSPGRISLKVRTSVSEPTTQNSTSFCGAQGMGLRKRLADTTVELPSGGTMMLAGLLQDDVRQVSNGMPGLSKVPVLGTLFRSKAYQRNETELVILITPYITRPTARNDMARPDDNFTPASDGAALFLNKVNRVYGSSETKLPNGRYHGVVGFIYK
jgi:pilus assembly protein CpaC